ncbi:unnamed protein product [Linum tenue]|uniref:RNase H type-1 domain-containing protein n=1 Tax=Linum tenue TaxID=586396 RepID=A0AAV0RZF8_9ROSI|nr:unnamed protein product [Linum tenue]
MAAAGGIIRDELGRCRGAFASKLGVCTITRTEIIGMLEGLEMAWKKGFRKVHLETDSTTTLVLLMQHRDTD